MNEICKNCGKTRTEHLETVGSDDETYVVCPDILDDTFTPSGRVSVPKEFIEAVRELCDSAPVDDYAHRVMVLCSQLATVRSMLDQMEGGAK